MQSTVLFPGQGSQEAGMGRDVAERTSEAMELWKKAEKISGFPLRSIYWESGDAALMADTAHLQPALTVVNLALWLLVSRTLQPACVAGHSLGEYAAFAAASVLPVEAVLELVSLRGKLMAAADPDGVGAMAAVLKLSRADVEDIVKSASASVEKPLVVANFNTPTQYVISGHKDAVEAALPLIRERKGRGMLLPVSGAFHSPLMAKAAKEMAQALNKVTWRRARFPVYANATGRGAVEGASLAELAGIQMMSSVYWTDTIMHQYTAGVRCFVELGPKGTLTRMVKPILEHVHAQKTEEGAPSGALDEVRLVHVACSDDIDVFNTSGGFGA